MRVRPLRVGIVCDLKEEEWPSMDLVAARLVETVGRTFAGEIEATSLRPRMRRRFTRVPGLAAHPRASILDRLANRHFDYARWLAQHSRSFDAFHIVDHSYAQLALALPPDSTLVTCHDLDAFRCLLTPDMERRSAPFRALARRTLDGLRRAVRVVCDSTAVRDELAGSGLVPPSKLAVVPIGVDDLFSTASDSEADAQARELLGDAGEHLDVLHVGSTIPRKRIDVLLEAVAAAHRVEPRVRLVRVGGPLGREQARLATSLGLDGSIVSLPFLDTRVLAAVYRRASVCLLPSDREGFGLPVAEALACGTPVVASDLPALRETGGEAAVYCTPGDADAFARAALACIARSADGDAVRRAEARRPTFTWTRYSTSMVELYRSVASGERVGDREASAS